MSKEEKNILDTMVKDGVVENTYADPNDTGKFASSPVEGSLGLPENPTNTGDGLDAATITNKDGTQKQLEYSWDKKAAERADLTYQSSVLEAKANYLNNRQQIESQGQQAQQQSDMISYSENQSVDKVGWTGGYVLDTERQMNYLKETIKSQMYGQMELQKYGYDTSLAAARLAYDTNKYDLALEYYNTALSRAFSLAQLTDYYVAPEVTEHLNQYKIASDILNGDTEGDKENAARVVQSVHAWFKDHGVSPAGVKTAAAIAREEAKAREDMQLKISMREAYGLTNDHFGKDADTFMSIQDGEDSYNLEEGTVKTINFNKMTGEEILNYIKGDSTGVAKEQYLSRMDQLGYQIELDFKDWCIKDGVMNEQGEVLNTTNMQEKILEYLSSKKITNIVEQEFSKFNTEDPEVLDLLESWDQPIELPGGQGQFLLMFTTKDRYEKLYREKYKEIWGRYPNEQPQGTNNGSSTGNPEIPDGLHVPARDTYTQLYNDLYGDAASVRNGLTKLKDNNAIKYVDNFDGVTGTSGYENYYTQGNHKAFLEYKQAVDNALGTKNIELLKKAYDEYNASEKDKYNWNVKPEAEKKLIIELAGYYDTYSKIERTADKIETASTLMFNNKGYKWSDNKLDYTGALFENIGDTWSDGYEVGDVGRSIGNGILGAGAFVVEGGGWLLSKFKFW